MQDPIRVAFKDGCATLFLQRPEVHNAFSDDTIHHLDQALTNLQNNPELRVLVLKSLGKSFSAGGDLRWMERSATYSFEQNHEDALKLARMLHRLYTFPVPTIAAVQGATIGGGTGLVACCDIAVASRSAFFCFSEVKIGLIPAVISPHILRAIGPRQAQRWFLTAEKFHAETAQAIGLVHEVVDEDHLDARVESLVEHICKNSPEALKATKNLTRQVQHTPIDASLLETTAEAIATARASVEGREGIRAFLEKRDPNWRRSR